MIAATAPAKKTLIYYYPPRVEDVHALRNSLLAAGFSGVAMRAGNFWCDNSRPERGWTHVAAPAYPGILAAYRDTEVEIFDGAGIARTDIPPLPSELDAAPQSDAVTILCPGKYLRNELADWTPEGLVIGVNEAARVHACDWHLANDGFAIAAVQGAVGKPGSITRRKYAATVPDGLWFALDRIGITECDWSVICALRVAEAMGAKTIHLVGHDLVEGNGCDGMTGHWDARQVASCGAETSAEITRLAAKNIRVERRVWVDNGVQNLVEITAEQKLDLLDAAKKSKKAKGK